MQAPRIVLLVDTSTGWGRRIVQGVLDFAMQHGPWDLLIEPKGQKERFEAPKQTGVDGVIARVSTPELATALDRLNIPTINVSALKIEGCSIPRVSTDGHAAAKLAVAHFRNRAIRNFAYVGPMEDSCVREHEKAFETRLAESGTPCHVFQPDSQLGAKSPWSIRDEHLILWLKQLPKPIGIFTWGFQIGRDIVSACREADIPVPHDVAVLGGDYDALLSNACHPSLSGIITPANQIGYMAASMLHTTMLGGKSPNASVFLEPKEIKERLSTDTLAIDDPYIKQALTLIRDHACDGMQIEVLLRKVPVARRTVERGFMQLIGRSPAQEMRRIRINNARRLLAQTNLPMQEIAEACGYATYNHLGAIFKKETGTSLGRYRNHARGAGSDLRAP